MLRLDERTIALGMEPDVHHVIHYWAAPLPAILGPKESWKEWEADAIVLAVDPAMVAAIASPRPAGMSERRSARPTPDEAFHQWLATVGAPVAPLGRRPRS